METFAHFYFSAFFPLSLFPFSVCPSVELSSLSLCMTNSKLGEPCFYVIGRTENTRLVVVPVSSPIFLFSLPFLLYCTVYSLKLCLGFTVWYETLCHIYKVNRRSNCSEVDKCSGLHVQHMWQPGESFYKVKLYSKLYYMLI